MRSEGGRRERMVLPYPSFNPPYFYALQSGRHQLETLQPAYHVTDTCIQLSNPNPYQDTKHSITPEISFVPLQLIPASNS